MGAWIEIGVDRVKLTTIVVAPLVGAWIEINGKLIMLVFPSVAPLVGAWIEITSIGNGPCI